MDFGDEPHVAEDAGVPSEVHSFALCLHHEASGLAEIDQIAVRGRGMLRMDHGDAQKVQFPRGQGNSAAFVHPNRPRNALPFQPHGQFVDRHHLRREALGQRNSVAQMVAMAMRQQDRITARYLMAWRITRITGEEGIDQHHLTRS